MSLLKNLTEIAELQENEKYAVGIFMLRMITADYEIHDKEMELFHMVCKSTNILLPEDN